jgi:hypothetical protein
MMRLLVCTSDIAHGGKNMRTLVAVVMLQAAAPALALDVKDMAVAEASPAEFRGLKWGAAPTGRLRPVGPQASDGLRAWVSKEPAVDFFGIPVVEESYLFIYGKLISGGISIDGEHNYAPARRQLLKMYGQPEFENRAQYVTTWKWPDGRTVALWYEPTDRRSLITWSDKPR